MSEAIGSNISITKKKEERKIKGRNKGKKEEKEQRKRKRNHTLTTIQMYKQCGRESPIHESCLTLKVLGTASAPQA